MKSPSVRIFLLSTLLVVTFIATIIIISYKQTATIKSSVYWVQHTQDVLYNSEKILSLIANYENAVIGIQINKIKITRPQLQYFKNDINNKLTDLKKLTIDNGVQQQYLKELSVTIEQKIGTANAISIFRDESTLNENQKIILKNDSLYTNDIKRIVTAMQVGEEKLLIVRKANNEKALLTIKLILYLLGGVIIVLLTAIVRRMQRTIFEKQTAALLHEHATLIDLSAEAIISTDKHFNIVQWSKGAEKLYGYTKMEVLGKGIIQFVASKIDASTRIDFIKNLQENGYWQGEIIQFDKHGNELNLVISYSQILNVDGTIKGYTSTRADITEIKKMQAALQKFNNELEIEVSQKTTEIKQVFERMAKAFLAFDNNWCCTYANEPIMQYTKASKEQLIGSKLEDLIKGITDTQFYKACIKAMQTQQMQELQEYIPYFNCWFESSIYPSPQGVSIYIADITKQKNIEEELITKKIQLSNLSNHIQNLREEERKIIARELHDDLGQMATVLKIDIRSIKNSLVNSTADVQTKVNNALETVDELIKKIRKISHELRPDLLDNMGLQAALKSHCLEFEKKAGISCFFYNETIGERFLQDVETALFRIYQESLTNVMRHAEATEVVVTLSKNNNEVLLQISDNGKGFVISKKGNTLGLIGIQERAAGINGKVTIDSSIGIGTTIAVTYLLQ
ncbi:MAG: PAS domain S-box protein [Pedobacter sp.]|nr:PAS domain S-box protein [Chitinophagaceae bacterium]